jgi:hypothetical protein
MTEFSEVAKKAPKDKPLGRCAFPYERPRISLLPYADRVSAPSPFRQPPGPCLLAPVQHLCAYPWLRESAAFRVLADMRRGYLAPLFLKEAIIVWWAQRPTLWGFWNGLRAWIVPLYSPRVGRLGAVPLLQNNARSANWYDLGFVLGAGSPISGVFAREEEAKGPKGRLTPARQTIELRNLCMAN